MTMRVTREGGGSVLSRTAVLMPRRDSPEVRTLEYRDELELAGLAPGEYVLTLEAVNQGGKRIDAQHVPFSIAAF